ncbi:MAG: MotA/TolQ/ExbB proton channel family protein [Haemophilus parahaemolyticus]|uniref:MotA/TolQ/ExbB proton channel family protein n=1 Tax=Haemophilus parahaemolyticus TaxID=735 RepID=UPI0027F1CB71|nr:MotA/TolQ/ExbB proton channel family protein [Haemophilus parahaemolyticus]MDQ6576193.1 MotA/TolQ/ExbB proton channel family protein [Haemophilus parahaemolyticus]
MLLTLIFSFLMVIVFLAVAFSFYNTENQLGKFGFRIMLSAPTILTSMGILGTFVGISYSLLEFNTNDLDKSIPILLDGMKIAFLTSAIGMTLSIFLKILMLILGKENEAEENKIIIDSIQKQTNSLNDNIPELLTKLVESSELQQKNIKLFERKLFKELRDFGTNITDITTQSVIDALESIVVNFNDSLAVQFGENFARLDESVKGMLEWQKGYKSLLDNLANNHELNARTLGEAKDSMLSIERSISNIPLLVKDFEKLIQFNQKQIGRIGEEMMIFTDIKDKALESFPEIKRRFTNIANTIEQASQQFNDQLVQHTHNISANLTKIAQDLIIDVGTNNRAIIHSNEQYYQELMITTNKIQKVLKTFDEQLFKQLTEMQLSFKQSVEEMTQEQVSQFRHVMENLSKENQHFVDKLSESTFSGLFGKVFKKK